MVVTKDLAGCRGRTPFTAHNAYASHDANSKPAMDDSPSREKQIDENRRVLRQLFAPQNSLQLAETNYARGAKSDLTHNEIPENPTTEASTRGDSRRSHQNEI